MSFPTGQHREKIRKQPLAAPRRPQELEDWLNRHIYHPSSSQLATWLSRTPVSANAVSVAGGIAVVGAALAYGLFSYPLGVALGLALHVSWHILDGADGDLARLKGKSSPAGEFIDGICDYLGHIMIYAVLALLIFQTHGHIAWFLVFVAALSRAVQANFYETIRRSYEMWVYDRSWLGAAAQIGEEQCEETSAMAVVRSYVGTANALVPQTARIDRLWAESQDRSAFHDAISQRSDLLLGGLAPFGANLRTLALGAAMAVQMPLLYILYEAAVLNAALCVSVFRKRRALTGLAEMLEAP